MGKTLLEGGTATAKVTPSCRSDEVRICDEDVSCCRRVIVPASWLSACWREKGVINESNVGRTPAGPLDGMGAEGPAFHLCLESLPFQKSVLHMHSCVCCDPGFCAAHPAVLLRATTTPSPVSTKITFSEQKCTQTGCCLLLS